MSGLFCCQVVSNETAATTSSMGMFLLVCYTGMLHFIAKGKCNDGEELFFCC